MATLAISPAAFAQGSDLPVAEPGTSIFWASASDGYNDDFRERVLAAGDDWLIFHTIDEWAEDPSPSPENIFVIYSGIDYRACDQDVLASDEERAAVAALYPLKEGDSVELTSMVDDAVIRVGEATEYFLMGAMRPAHKVQIDYDDDELDEHLVVLDDQPLTVRIDWDTESWDKVMLVTSGRDASPETLTADQLGSCAVLLDEN